MADSNTPSKIGNKLDALPKEELIKYIKKQVVQVKDLKKKNEELNSILKHEKKEVERLTQEQKSWLSRGISAEFEKKEKIEKKERELVMAAQLGQKMLAENDELRQRCSDLEKENQSVRQEMNDIVSQIYLEKETIEETLTMIQEQYKTAKIEAQNMKDALENAAIEQDKEHENWEKERKELHDKLEELTKSCEIEKSTDSSKYSENIMNENQLLKEEIDQLQMQLNKFKEQQENRSYDDIVQINQELQEKSLDVAVEMRALNESVESLQESCSELKAKNMELNNYVEMLNLERDENNSYTKQLHEDMIKVKEDKEKTSKSLKTLKSKLERANAIEVEIKQEISTITSERNELQLIVKNLQREKKTLIQANKKLKERVRGKEEKRSSEELSNEKEEKALVSKLQTRVDELVATLQSLNEEKMHQESEIEELFKAQDELQAKYDKECMEKKSKDAVIQELKEKMEEKIQMEECECREEKLQQSHVANNFVTKLETEEGRDVRKQMLEDREKIENLQMQLAKITNDLENERYEKRIIESSIRENVSSIEEFEENEKKILQLQMSTEELETLKCKLKSYEEELNGINKLLLICNNKEDCKIDVVGNITVEINSLISKRDELQECVNGNKELLESTQNENASLETELQTYKKELAECKQNICDLEKALEVVNEQLKEIEEAKCLLVTENQASNLELKRKQEKMDELEDMLSKLNGELLDANKIRDVYENNMLLQEEIETQSKIIEKYEKDMKDNENEHLEMKDLLSKLNEELCTLRKAHDSVEVSTITKLQNANGKNSSEPLTATDFDLQDEKNHSESDSVEEMENDPIANLMQCTDLVEKEPLSPEGANFCERIKNLEGENNELLENLSSLSNDMKDLKSSLSVKDEKIAESEKLIDSICLEKQDLLASIATSNTTVHELEKTIFSLSSQINDIESSLLQEQMKSSDLVIEINRMNSTNSQLGESLSITFELTQELQKTLDHCEDFISSVKTSDEEGQPDMNLNELKTSHPSTEENAMKKQPYSNLEIAKNIHIATMGFSEQIMTLDKENKLLSDKIKITEMSLDKEQQKNININLELQTLSGNLQMSEEKLFCLEKEKKELNSFLNVKISEHEVSKQNSENLEIELNSLKLALHESDNNLTAVQSLYQDLKLLCDNKEMKICEYEETISMKNTKLENMITELSEMRSNMSLHLSEIDIKERRIDCLEKELQTAVKKVGKLEMVNNEKSEKLNKLKSVAIKAKKEMDINKEKTAVERNELQNAKEEIKTLQLELETVTKDCLSYKAKNEDLQKQQHSLEDELQNKSERIKLTEAEISELTDTVDKLVSSSADLEDKMIKSEKETAERCTEIVRLSKELYEANGEIYKLNESIRMEKEKYDDTKCQLTKVNEDYGNAMKDVHQMKMMTLEMQDCHRTVESLQNKLAEKEKENQLLTMNSDNATNIIHSQNEKIASLEEQYSSSIIEMQLVNTILMKKTEEAEALLTEKSQMENKEIEYQNKIEQLAQGSEDQMLQISNLHAEKEKISLQLKNAKDFHERDIQSLEARISRAQTEISLLQEAYDSCKQEFENYKIRAQNVLKQHKLKNTNVVDSQIREEKLKLEELLHQCKDKLREKSDQHSKALVELEEFHVEHERLLQRYSNCVKDSSDKEDEWKKRFAEYRAECLARFQHDEETLKEMAMENQLMQAKYKDIDDFERIKEKYQEEIQNLKEQLSAKAKSMKLQDSKTKRYLTDHDSKENPVLDERSSPPENLKLQPNTTAEFSSGLVERPGAEGMDSTELEAIDKTSQPTTPATIDSASFLETLLSPSEETAHMQWPTSPTVSREEGLKLRVALSTAEKNVEHISELLADSEGNNARWEEQVRVLKAEIRRMQQNQEREEALHNLEYLKNVIIKFMKCASTEKECLVPVLSTMLKLDPDEKSFLLDFARGGDMNEGEPSSAWSSYVYRWTSFS